MDIPVKEWLWPNVSTFVTTLLVLAFTYWLFMKHLFGPTRAFLARRADHISKNIQDAEKQSKIAQDTLVAAELHLDKTTKESTEYLAAQIKDAKAKAADLLESAKSDINNLRDNAKQSLEAAELNARKNLRKEVSALSIQAAKKVLGSEIDVKASEKLVDDFIKDIK